MSGSWSAASALVTADSRLFTADGGSTAAIVTLSVIGALADLDHFWGNDLTVGNTGDLAVVTGTIRGQQRILRRLLTNPGDYIFHPEYGGGLPQYIGKPIDIPKITGVIRSQIALEAVVAKSPPAQITVQQSANDFTAFTVTIAYNDATTNTPVVLAFSVSN